MSSTVSVGRQGFRRQRNVKQQRSVPQPSPPSLVSSNDPRLQKSIAIQRDLLTAGSAAASSTPALTPEEKAEASRLYENLAPFGISIVEVNDLVQKYGAGSAELEERVNMIVNDSLDGVEGWHTASHKKRHTSEATRGSPSRRGGGRGRGGNVRGGRGGRRDIAPPPVVKSTESHSVESQTPEQPVTQSTAQSSPTSDAPPAKVKQEPPVSVEPEVAPKVVPAQKTWASLLKRAVVPDPTLDPPLASVVEPIVEEAHVAVDETTVVETAQDTEITVADVTPPAVPADPPLETPPEPVVEALVVDPPTAEPPAVEVPITQPVTQQPIPPTQPVTPTQPTQRPASPPGELKQESKANASKQKTTRLPKRAPLAMALQERSSEAAIPKAQPHPAPPAKVPPPMKVVEPEVVPGSEPPAAPVMIPPSATAFHSTVKVGERTELQTEQPSVVLPRFLTSSVSRPHTSGAPNFVFGSYRRREDNVTARDERPAERQSPQAPRETDETTHQAVPRGYQNYQYASSAQSAYFQNRAYYLHPTPPQSSQPAPSNQPLAAYVPPYQLPSPQQPSDAVTDTPAASNITRPSRAPEYLPWNLYTQSMDYSAYGPAYAMGAVYPQTYVMNGPAMGAGGGTGTESTVSGMPMPQSQQDAHLPHSHVMRETTDDARRQMAGRNQTETSAYQQASRIDRSYPPPGLGGAPPAEQISMRNPMGPFGSGPTNMGLPTDDAASAAVYRRMYQAAPPHPGPPGSAALYMSYAPHHYTPADDAAVAASHVAMRDTRQSTGTQQYTQNSMTQATRMTADATTSRSLFNQQEEDYSSSTQGHDETTSRLNTANQYEFLRPSQNLLTTRVDYDTRNKDFVHPPTMGGPQYSSRYTPYSYSSGWPSPRTMGAYNHFQSGEGLRR
eukprot:Blabericola_migrator_1__609@NODE_114_length_13851_cov_137_870429_g102_i0_p2_GENE_NODE_114_length_13851_cov_137_870429_g102_i0NODE_114_length_13851_cov_137_870429_g102_i0_p2_ORF_typecomplete_len899_score165_80_NODE_114_length_13851_cov_137_870429_g102_i026845380